MLIDSPYPLSVHSPPPSQNGKQADIFSYFFLLEKKNIGSVTYYISRIDQCFNYFGPVSYST